MNATQRNRLQRRFLRAIADSSHFNVLFEHLPGISFFAKDAEGRIMRTNRTFRERLEIDSEEDIIGRTDFELFPEGLAKNFRRDDLEVMRTGKPKLDLVELFLNQQGMVDWFVTNKFPVFDREGKAIGVMGTVQDYQQRRLACPYPEIEKAVAHILKHFRESINMANLAQQVGLSTRHFDRRFNRPSALVPRVAKSKRASSRHVKGYVSPESALGNSPLNLAFPTRVRSHFTFAEKWG